MKTILNFILLILFCISCNKDTNDIDTSPVAAFTVNESAIIPGTAVTFTNVSFDQNGSIASWEWNFGDGETSTEFSPTHVYNKSGEYKVALTVLDNSEKINVNTFSKTIFVSTTNVSPNILWSFSLPGKVEDSSPSVNDDGTVYIGCSAKGVPNVYAISEGKAIWSYTTGDIVRSAPAIHPTNGNIYLGSYDDYLYGFTPEGNLAMKFDMDNNAKYSGPVFGLNGEIYIGSQTDELIAVDQGGIELWRYDMDGDVDSTPAVGQDGKIYVGSTGDFFYAMNPDGTLDWKSEFGSWTATATALGADGTIYFTGEGNNLNSSSGGVLIAYTIDGTEKWRVNLTNKINQGGPSIAGDGTIYAGGFDKELVAYNPSDGSIKWSYATYGNILSTPAIDNDGNIYFTDDEGYFYVVDANGEKKWKELKLGVRIWNSPAIGKDGVIYIAADQSDETAVLYALQTEATGLADGGWPMRSKNAKHTGR